MSQIGKHVRTTKRPIPEPKERPIAVPNWPAPRPVPIVLPDPAKVDAYGVGK